MYSTSAAQGWAKKTTETSVWLVFILAVLLTGAGIAITFFDVQTSYYGWGKAIHKWVDAGPNTEGLGLIVSSLPTLVQMAWIAALAAKMREITSVKSFRVVFAIMFVLDTALDIAQLYISGAMSLFWAVLLALGVYFAMSEFLVSFFAPLAWALAASLLKTTARPTRIPEWMKPVTPPVQESSRRRSEVRGQ